MIKTLNEDTLKSELAGSAFFMRAEAPLSPTLPRQDISRQQKSPKKTSARKEQVKEKDEPQAPSSVLAPSAAMIAREGVKVDPKTIMGRPKAFYITVEQDKKLDALVSELSIRLAGRLNFKVDRSVVIRLILDTQSLTSEGTVERLSDKLVGQLVSQLTD
jgi:hypothetical protein